MIMWRSLQKCPIFYSQGRLVPRRFAVSCSAQNEGEKLYSSLYISTRDNQKVSSVLKPSYDAPFLRFVHGNLEQIRNVAEKRGLKLEFNEGEMKGYIEDFIKFSTRVKSLKAKRSKLLGKAPHKIGDVSANEARISHLFEELNKVRSVFYDLEEKVVPFLLAIPNNIRDDMQSTSVIIEEFDGTKNKALEKYLPLNFARLGYINNIHNYSIIGPNARYLTGQGALLKYALVEFISTQLESNNFSQINGLDLVKSAIIETTNTKDYKQNSYMIKLSEDDDEDNQRLHLVGESSLESLIALLSKNKLKMNRYFQVGSAYYEDKVCQSHHIRVSSLIQSDSSNTEMENIYQLWWKILSDLGLKCQSRKCDIASLHHSEYAKYELCVWQQSEHDYIPVGSISHYSNYLTQRMGIPDYYKTHLISSSIDLMSMLHCIMEHYQDPTNGQIGKPECLATYLIL